MPKQRREWKLYNEDIERTFTQHQTQITQLDSSITLQASTITNLSGKVEEYYSELTVADTGIRTEVAKKVGADTIISTINQSAESVTIDASKINLNGFVTFTNLAAYGDHTIALGDGSNTLTIDGSTITGTNLSGWIGYKLRPSSLDIYSFTSNNDLVGRLSATKSSKMGNSDVGVALFADYGDWITIGRASSSSGSSINAILWSDPSTHATYMGWEGATYSSFGALSTHTAVGYNGVDGFTMTSTIVNIGSNSHSVTANAAGLTCLDLASNGCWVGNDARAMTLTGSTTYVNSEGDMTIHADGNITLAAGNGAWGFRTYNSGSLTGFMIANDANQDSSKHCYIDLGLNGNVYISGVHLYFNGTQIA